MCHSNILTQMLSKLTKLTKFQKIGAGAVIVSGALAGFLWYAVWRESRGDLLTVAFLDIGQGDAIFVEAPNGNQMIIDGGPNASLLRELGKVMPFYDRTIDVLVVTNPDKDHFAGFVDVLKRYQVDLVIESGTKNDSEIYKTFDAAVKKEGSKRVIAKRGMSLVLDDGAHAGGTATARGENSRQKVSFDVIFPVQDVSKFKTNDGSIIGRL
ncbi:MAG: MBL fold metallo-hydrolase, partial [Patescibacteria group bacterium]